MTDVAAQQAVRVDAAKFEAWTERLFREVGSDPDDAHVAARVLVNADIRGTHTHGINWLGPYLERLKEGTLNRAPRPTVLKETVATTLWDGDNGLGHVVGYRVMEDVIRRVRESGAGIHMAVVRNSHHFGAAGYFALMAAEANLIGLSMANTAPVIGLPGGRTRQLGNGPFSWATPATSDLGPMVFDVAWSTTAGSRVILHMRRDEPVPDGWLTDGEGKPTNDPKALMAGGAMTPLGAHKGYGMALMVEILAGVLGGGAMVMDMDSHFDTSHTFLVIDPEAFLPGEEFRLRLDRLVRTLRDSPKAEGSERILVPGELELDHEADTKAGGLEMYPELWTELRTIAETYGVTDELEAARV